MKNLQKGFIVPLLLVIIALLLVGGGVYVYTQQKQNSQPAVVDQTTQTTQPIKPAIPTQPTENSNQFSLSSKIVGTDTNSIHILYSVTVANGVAKSSGDWTLKLSCPSGVNTVKYPSCGSTQRVLSGPTIEVLITNATNQVQTVVATAQLLSGVDNATPVFTANNSTDIQPSVRSFLISPTYGQPPLTVTATFLFGLCDGVGYQILWGDGTDDAKGSNSYGAACTPFPTPTVVSKTHVYSQPGTYVVKLSGEDFAQKTKIQSIQTATITVYIPNPGGGGK